MNPLSFSLSVSLSLFLSLSSECVFNQDINLMCGGVAKKQIQYELYMIIDFEKKNRQISAITHLSSNPPLLFHTHRTKTKIAHCDYSAVMEMCCVIQRTLNRTREDVMIIKDCPKLEHTKIDQKTLLGLDLKKKPSWFMSEIPQLPVRRIAFATKTLTRLVPLVINLQPCSERRYALANWRLRKRFEAVQLYSSLELKQWQFVSCQCRGLQFLKKTRLLQVYEHNLTLQTAPLKAFICILQAAVVSVMQRSVLR